MTRRTLRTALALSAALLALTLAVPASASAASFGAGGDGREVHWGLTIQSAVCVQGARVLLGEIAQPLGALPHDEWERMAATELWPAPEALGRSYSISRQRLAKLLRHYLGKNARRCTLPSGLTIQRGGAVVNAQDLEESVNRALAARLAAMPGRAELSRLSLPNTVFLDGPFSYVDVQTDGTLESGRVNLRLDLCAGDGTVLKTVRASAFVSQWVAVPCAAKPLNNRQVLDGSSVEYCEKNLAHSRGEYWDGTGGPWRMRRSVGVGQPILRQDLEIQPAVGRGQAVTLVYQGKHVHLQTLGEALADGAVGQAIAVKNRTSGKTVQAVVVSQDTVAVR